MTKIWSSPAMSRWNAIFWPLGKKYGSVSSKAGLFVIWDCPVPSKFITQIWRLDEGAGSRLKRIFSPLADHEGSASSSGPLVSCIRFWPFGSIEKMSKLLPAVPSSWPKAILPLVPGKAASAPLAATSPTRATRVTRPQASAAIRSRYLISISLLLLRLELDLEGGVRGLTEVVGQGGGDRRLALLAGRRRLLERLLALLGDLQRDRRRGVGRDLRRDRGDRELLGLRGHGALGGLRRLAGPIEHGGGVLVRARHCDADPLDRLRRRLARKVAVGRVERLPVGRVVVGPRRRVAGQRRQALVEAAGIGEEDVAEGVRGVLALECDLRALGREDRRDVVLGPAGHRGLTRAVGVHDEDVVLAAVVAVEDDLLAVGREVGR